MQASHKIIHLDVRPSPEPSAQPEGSLDHRYKVMVIASPFVGSRLAERIAAQEADWLRRMVRQLDAPAYKAAAGALFEAYAHRRLQAGGMFKVGAEGWGLQSGLKAASPLQLPHSFRPGLSTRLS